MSDGMFDGVSDGMFRAEIYGDDWKEGTNTILNSNDEIARQMPTANTMSIHVSIHMSIHK